MPTIISWTNETWNPVTGCSRVSEECRHCYAERLSTKFHWTTAPWTAANAEQNVRCRPERLSKPYGWKDARMVFTNSMSDMFHDQVPDEFLHLIFDVIEGTPRHTYQCLTKRPERAARWQRWPHNVWMGTTCGHSPNLHRVDTLRECGARIKFISAEPLLDSLAMLDVTGIDWVIVGGESGPGFRHMDHQWARDIRDICVRNHVAYFFKQDSAFRTETRPWLLEPDGSAWIWNQIPGAMKPPTLVPDQLRRSVATQSPQSLVVLP